MKHPACRFLLSIFVCLMAVFPIRGLAMSLESETDFGTTSNAETISGDGDFDFSEKPNDGAKSKPTSPHDVLSWNLSVAATQTRSADSATQTTIVDKTTELSVGLDYTTVSRWDFDGGFTYSATPDENLRELGPQFSFGYVHRFTDSQTHGFSPSLGAHINTSSLNYTQTFTGEAVGRRGRTRPTKGTNELTQVIVGASVNARPVRWLSVKVYADSYRYNRDVNDFLQYLDSARLGQTQMISGFSSTVSGLPSRDVGLVLRFRFFEDWEIALSGSQSTSATDGSKATSSSLLLSNDVTEKLTLSIGAKADHSQTADDRLAIFKVSYDF